MRLLTTFSITILLASCATTMTNYYKPTVQSWQGGSTKNLVQRWGRPDRVLNTADGKTIYLYQAENYRNINTPSYPSVGMHVDANGRPLMTGSPEGNMSWNRGAMSISCVALFEAGANGKILSTQTQGNNCYMGASFAARKVNPENVSALGNKN
jgi:hypothetical protein